MYQFLRRIVQNFSEIFQTHRSAFEFYLLHSLYLTFHSISMLVTPSYWWLKVGVSLTLSGQSVTNVPSPASVSNMFQNIFPGSDKFIKFVFHFRKWFCDSNCKYFSSLIKYFPRSNLTSGLAIFTLNRHVRQKNRTTLDTRRKNGTFERIYTNIANTWSLISTNLIRKFSDGICSKSGSFIHNEQFILRKLFEAKFWTSSLLQFFINILYIFKVNFEVRQSVKNF